MNILELGKPYRRAAGLPQAVYIDKADYGFELIINMDKPKQTEIDHYGKGRGLKIRAGVIDGLICFAIKADGEPWQDCNFNPRLTANTDYSLPADGNIGYALTIILTEMPMGIVRKLRVVGLSRDISEYIYNAVMDDIKKSSYTVIPEYYKAVRELQAKYTSDEIAELCEARYELKH